MTDTTSARRMTAKSRIEPREDRSPEDLEAIHEATTDSFAALLNTLLATGEEYAGSVFVELNERTAKLDYFVSD